MKERLTSKKTWQLLVSKGDMVYYGACSAGSYGQQYHTKLCIVEKVDSETGKITLIQEGGGKFMFCGQQKVENEKIELLLGDQQWALSAYHPRFYKGEKSQEKGFQMGVPIISSLSDKYKRVEFDSLKL